MTENDNIRLIKEHFAAFSRGDIKAALEMVADEVDWQSPVTNTLSEKITWSRPRYNRKEVMQFFMEMADKVQPEKFEILGFLAQDDKVVVEGRNKGIIRSTGKAYEHDWVMVFTIRHSQIVRHRHYYDSADIVAAYQK